MADNLKPLLKWAVEREKVRLRKLADKKPYTRDPILATYRFCNVRRADDRVSKWLRDNVLTQENIDLDLRSFLEFSAWCRWVNWPPTIKAVMDAGLYPQKKINWAKVGKLVDKLASEGKAWTGAYMIRAPKVKGAKKGAFVAQEVIGKHFRKALPSIIAYLTSDEINGDATYQRVHEALCRIPNFGSFMAGQVAGDWTYTSLLKDAPDLKMWAPMGPGSIRGFNRIIGNPKIRQKPAQELWQAKLVIWRSLLVKRLGPAYEGVTALDLQNCLCETDKVLRVLLDEGRPRAKYSPHTY